MRVHPTIFVEHYSGYLKPQHVIRCITRYDLYSSGEEKEAKKRNEIFTEEQKPFTWILTTGCSKKMLQSFGAIQDEELGVGVYRLPTGLNMGIVVIFDGAWLRIADSVLEDPRWEHLAATGLLSAKWTKGGLMLKPASHKSFTVDAAILSGMDCCAVCEFFDGYLCRGEESPLYKRDVDRGAESAESVEKQLIYILRAGREYDDRGRKLLFNLKYFLHD